MKFWKLTLITFCAFFAISATVLMSSCEKDACTELKCKNGSACTEGFCRCPTGYEGAECEIQTAQRFVGTYYGLNHCDETTSLLDTLDVVLAAQPNVLRFSLRHNAELIEGVADGYRITVPDQPQGNGIRKVAAELTVDRSYGTKMTLFVERDFFISSPGARTVCTFVGFKK